MTPPAADELEVSLFGPGVGECVVVHLGHDEWIIVDSCLDPGTGEAVALRYLRDAGVDPASIKLLVASHWHDDHIKGISQILDIAKEAAFATSRREHAVIMKAVARAREMNLSDTGADEFSKILRIIGERLKKGQRPESAGPRWVAEGMRLFKSGKTKSDAQVWALSPSPGTEALDLYMQYEFFAKKNEPQRRAVALTPNERSVVLWVSSGDRSVLLGGDLEHSANPAVGWKAVVASSSRPRGRAEVFKLAHHGSENADSPDVWTEMLTAGPIALVAPFCKGRKPLPSRKDISRILERTSSAYCTAPPTGYKPPRRDPMVEKTIKGVARDRRVITGDVGQVRVRFALEEGDDDDPLIELFSPAFLLSA